MVDVKFKPIRHSHKEFLARGATREGFVEAYDALSLEYEVANQMLKARSPNEWVRPGAQCPDSSRPE